MICKSHCYNIKRREAYYAVVLKIKEGQTNEIIHRKEEEPEELHKMLHLTNVTMKI